MKFLNQILRRSHNERPFIIGVGHPADDAKVPRAATLKKLIGGSDFCMTRLPIKLFIKRYQGR